MSFPDYCKGLLTGLTYSIHFGFLCSSQPEFFCFCFLSKQKSGYAHLSTLRTAHCSWDDRQLKSSPRLQGFIGLSPPAAPVFSLAILFLSLDFSASVEFLQPSKMSHFLSLRALLHVPLFWNTQFFSPNTPNPILHELPG